MVVRLDPIDEQQVSANTLYIYHLQDYVQGAFLVQRRDGVVDLVQLQSIPLAGPIVRHSLPGHLECANELKSRRRRWHGRGCARDDEWTRNAGIDEWLQLAAETESKAKAAVATPRFQAKSRLWRPDSLYRERPGEMVVAGADRASAHKVPADLWPQRATCRCMPPKEDLTAGHIFATD